MDQKTIKIYQKNHKELQEAHAKYIGETGEVISFIKFCDMIITDGLKQQHCKKK